MSAYYNEIDPSAAQWLRNLIEAGHITPGYVDERSIEDVTPGDLAGYTQCHFFAGIGVWSYALRQAGWSDDRPVWTGSCPCQPFSSAGAGAGFADERHLWPAFHWLIGQCRPSVVFGEQVASKAVNPWIDLVQTDLEALGYAFAGIPFPSACVGAPHIRDRLFWVGHTDEPRPQGHAGHGDPEGWQGTSGSAAPAGVSGEVANASCKGRIGNGRQLERGENERNGPEAPVRQQRLQQPKGLLPASGLAHPNSGQHDRSRSIGPSGRSQHSDSGATAGGQPATGPTNGFWADADWLFCRDGKWRPVEPGTFPLAHGAPARVVRLRAYGNAINAESAREFIGSVMECIG